jgi:putative lipoprotein
MIRTLLLVAALAACSPAPEAKLEPQAASANAMTALPAETPSWATARAAGVDFRAVGQEPGWMLDIYTRGPMVLEWSYGEHRIALPLTEAQAADEGVTRYETRTEEHQVAITIRRAPCQDVMSGEAYPARVEVTVNGETLTGCGKSV